VEVVGVSTGVVTAGAIGLGCAGGDLRPRTEPDHAECDRRENHEQCH
jgi:hypothetical protein